MCRKLLSHLLVILIVSIVHGTQGPFIIPPDIEPIGPPICTSSNSLCGLDYRYVNENDNTDVVLHSDHVICSCPDTTGSNCSVGTDWDHQNNSLIQRLLAGPGNQLLVKISYCELPEPKRSCRFNEPVLVTRGRGHFMFELVDELRCRCDRPLVAQSSWMQGEYDYVMYGCGQPRCAKRTTTICAEVTYSNGGLKSRSFCRCRRSEICSGRLPTKEGELVPHKCL